MPSLSSFSTTKPLKILLLGDPGSGKTGALTSLVRAGYKLRIYDFDNLLEPLLQFVQHECPDKLGNVAYQTFTDKIKTPDMPTMMIGATLRVQPFTVGTPVAFINSLRQLEHWKTPEEDLGDPGKWGPDTIVVIDSLSQMSMAAFRYVHAMNPAARESMTYYGAAQTLLTNTLANLYSDQFNTNVIVIAHINYDKNHLEVTKGFPRAIGAAMNTTIGSYFNAILMAETQGSGTGIRRVIRTNSTGIVDLKNPASFKVPDTLPLSSGLADFFKAVRTPTEKGK